MKTCFNDTKKNETVDLFPTFLAQGITQNK